MESHRYIPQSAPDVSLCAVGEPFQGSLRERLLNFERLQIEATLASTGGVRVRAAEKLGLTYRGLVKKMRRLGL